LGVVVRHNVLHDIGGDGIVVVATDGALVEHNVVSNANQRSAGYNVAIWPWSADNTIIQHNEAYGTRGQRDGEGFDSDWNSRNTVIPRSGVKRLGHAKGGLVRASLMQALERAPHGFWRDLRLGTAGSKSGQFCSSRSISRMHLKQPALWRYDRPE